MFNIILFQPDIAANTGNIIRLCANTGCQLHLIKPMGFTLDDKKMQRAGLDYHEFASLKTYDGWQNFLDLNASYLQANASIYAFTTKGCTQNFQQAQFKAFDYLLFGSETKGLPDSVRNQLPSTHLLRLPMLETSRSLNLANSVAVGLYHAWGQHNFNHSHMP